MPAGSQSKVKAKLSHQKQLYEAVRTDRNLYSKKLVESQDEIAEMKRKFKIMSHQIEQLKEEIKEKEERLKRGHHAHNRMQKECEFFKDQMERAKRKEQTLKSHKETQQAEIKKLESRILEEEDRRKQQKKKYEETISERDVLGTQLIHRNDELALQYEKIKIQQRTLQNGDLAFKQRLEEARALGVKEAQLKRELHIGKQQVLNIDDLKRQACSSYRGNSSRCNALLLALLPPLLAAQQVDPRGDEDTRNAGIRISNNGEDEAQFAVLDGRWRWLYTSESKDCGSAAVRGAAALERCYLQGLSATRYAEAYGVEVGVPNNRAITMRFATKDANAPSPNYGSRIYLTDGKGYTLFAPMGGDIAFDVDVSQVPAGMNAAVYLVSMDRYGNLNSVSPDGVMNTAGWMRGLGYCDAQCPKDLKFVQGQGYNKDHKLASCCPEMDLFEGNRFVQAVTAHPCKLAKESVCDSETVEDCKAACDSAGADINTFRESGPGHALFDMVDVSQPFKINTTFVTDNGAANGTLVDIVQILSQNGVTKARLSMAERFLNPRGEGFRPYDDFTQVYGGLKQMGEALRRGMVMVLALWADPSGNMNWLDSCHTNKTDYDCSLHEKFDASVWTQAVHAHVSVWDFGMLGCQQLPSCKADAVKPGIWRGPADYYPDYAARPHLVGAL
ncbi:cbhB [Symbiodinium natans]|uniref:cellulose 1,4-beta-cellobiosidase (non-reducing end) n=1 Tax=Symbiodinium natans TaxID=878477 RepID=A0A812PG24_9DINO|nr:cbhB [Symbiodinium natans]